jgi:hypothetical protein
LSINLKTFGGGIEVGVGVGISVGESLIFGKS